MIQHPIAVYINWSSYDELTDALELTEALAMRQFDELVRLRGLGVRFDYYLIDAFWYARDGGYRRWRTPHWGDDGAAWLAACARQGVKPGLWFGCNQVHGSKLDVIPAWRDSMNAAGTTACLCQGGFLPHLMESLALWYARGVRLFKFDFMDLNAATPALERTVLPSEIRAMNSAAFRSALLGFRAGHPEAVLIAYNGFEERDTQTRTDQPPCRSMDGRWLDCFDSFYTGDPRPADVPMAGFWRAKDVYSDHQVAQFHAQGFPLQRLDNAGFMIGTTGTCYFRGKVAWKGMLLLQLARGGWVNTYYGNLELLDAADARWFARAQALWLPLQQRATLSLLGGLPGRAEPYGFAAEDPAGAVYALVNPSQAMATITLPAAGGRVLFHDAGYTPRLAGRALTLAPEQLVVVGTGAFAGAEWDLGVGEDTAVAAAIRPLVAAAEPAGANAVRAVVADPPASRLRVIMRQLEPAGSPWHYDRARRSSGGAPPHGATLGTILRLGAEQDGRVVPLAIAYDKAIWSGLSWAVGEIAAADLRPGRPLTISGSSAEVTPVRLLLEVHALEG